MANTAFFVNNFLMGLVRAFQAAGHAVAVVCPEDAQAARIRERGIRVIPLLHLDRKGTNPLKDLRLLVELVSIYRREKPGLTVHYTVKPNIYGGFACRLLGLKAVNVITGLGYLFIKKTPATMVAKLMYRLALRNSIKVAFLNRDDMEVFREGRLVREGGAFRLPGTGIDAAHFRPAPGTAEGAPVRPPVFLMLGRILWDKGVGEFIEAAALVKRRQGDGEFWILGAPDPGNPSAVPEDFLRESEARGTIRYLGQTEDVRGMIARADVVVLPSYREGIPRALLEAMAMEKPVIATDSSGCRDVVEEGRNGLLVPVRDAVSLADAMLKLMVMEPGQRAALGRRGRDKVLSEFQDEVVSRIFLSEIAGALNP